MDDCKELRDQNETPDSADKRLRNKNKHRLDGSHWPSGRFFCQDHKLILAHYLTGLYRARNLATMRDDEPAIGATYGPLRGGPSTTVFVDVQNVGRLVISKVEVVIVYEFPEAQENTEESRREFPQLSASKGEETGGIETLDNQGQSGPLAPGETREFLLAHEALPRLFSSIESLPADAYYLAAVLDGSVVVVLDGPALYEFVRKLEGESNS